MAKVWKHVPVPSDMYAALAAEKDRTDIPIAALIRRAWALYQAQGAK